ncbi:MAG TPA: ester cyclase [Thermoanaerobaculia bacterium]|nr:ester cyclase [Thermoanaerobaculia bacterium]
MPRASWRLLFVLLAGLFAFPSLAQEAPAPPGDPPVSTEAANKALVRRYVDEVLSAGKLELLDEMVAPEYVDRTPGVPDRGRGPAALRAAQQQMRRLFSQIRYTLESLVAEGDEVAARYTVRAIRPGEGADAGRTVTVTGITLFRIVDGRIRETWIVNDQLGMFQQLGYRLQEPEAKNEPTP